MRGTAPTPQGEHVRPARRQKSLHGGTDRWEEPREMSMWNEQANEKVPRANEKVPRRNLPPDAQESGMNWETPAKGTL